MKFLRLVSHDRYLIDRLVTQVWELREGRLPKVFKGSYREFVLRRAASTAPGAARQTLPPPEPRCAWTATLRARRPSRWRWSKRPYPGKGG